MQASAAASTPTRSTSDQQQQQQPQHHLSSLRSRFASSSSGPITVQSFTSGLCELATDAADKAGGVAKTAVVSVKDIVYPAVSTAKTVVRAVPKVRWEQKR